MENANNSVKMLQISEKFMEIGRSSKDSEKGTTVYSLFREGVDKDSFFIRVANTEMCESGHVKGKLSDVSLLFEKMINGEVPPYILPEILDDYSMEKESFFANI